uniref:Uncharacterized protein n=1 Tax=Siphoviridae sp. ctGMq5 TaxID=2826220 RepID=A0A8S5NNH3_9CAUD|nr:MAG TPA: hypothetical protein [Siphoviridae sp. ctGMq5]
MFFTIIVLTSLKSNFSRARVTEIRYACLFLSATSVT